MAEWELNIQKQFADEIVAGRKMFEIRKEDDKIFNKGDFIKFHVGMAKFIANGEEFISFEGDHDIHKKVYEITYVIHGWGIKEGYCVFGIRELAPGGVIRPKPDYKPEEGILLIPKLPRYGRKQELTMLAQIKNRCKGRNECKGCWYNCSKHTDTRACMISGIPENWKL